MAAIFCQQTNAASLFKKRGRANHTDIPSKWDSAQFSLKRLTLDQTDQPYFIRFFQLLTQLLPYAKLHSSDLPFRIHGTFSENYVSYRLLPIPLEKFKTKPNFFVYTGSYLVMRNIRTTLTALIEILAGHSPPQTAIKMSRQLLQLLVYPRNMWSMNIGMWVWTFLYVNRVSDF